MKREDTERPGGTDSGTAGGVGALERGLIALLLLGIFTLTAAWWIRAVAHRGQLGQVGSVGGLDRFAFPEEGWPALPIFTLLLGALLFRRRALLRWRAVAAATGLLLLSLWTALATPVGHSLAVVLCASALALLISGHLRAPPGGAHRRAAPFALWGLVALPGAIFSMHRHWAFGSGSWDMGCMIHNFYRASRFMDTISPVLGEVDFLGDHFMVGIYLLAPLFWINASGYMLLLIQSISLAASAPAIYLIAKHKGAAPLEAGALGLCAGLCFGMQSAAFFDAHEITVGLGFLAFGLWAFETERLRAATVLLFIFALFKESLGAYLVALGLLAIWRGLARKDPRHVRFGLGWIAFGAIWFVLVNRVFMPALIARANLPEPHETFGDFGPTVFEAALGILKQPLKATGALFIPDEKLYSQVVTLGSFGGICFLAPELLIAALPLLAERFLSSKATMWQMGYHYAAPLSLYAAWAAALGWPRAVRIARWILGKLEPGLAPLAPFALVVLIVSATALMNGFGYRHPANFYRWRESYYSHPDRRASNAAAVAYLDALGRDAKLAVQNRVLPHLADRPYIYRLGKWQKADWVLLSIGESAWPWDNGFPERLARQLYRDPGWRLVFAQNGTAIFARAGVSQAPEVQPTPLLRLPPKAP